MTSQLAEVDRRIAVTRATLARAQRLLDANPAVQLNAAKDRLRAVDTRIDALRARHPRSEDARALSREARKIAGYILQIDSGLLSATDARSFTAADKPAFQTAFLVARPDRPSLVEDVDTAECMHVSSVILGQRPPTDTREAEAREYYLAATRECE